MMRLTLVFVALLVAPPVANADDDDPRFNAEMERLVIDKPAIAARHAERMVGLREEGNPHVPTGSVLREATLAEPRGEEYRETLRDRALGLYGSREPDWSHPTSVDAVPEAEVASVARNVDSERSGSLLTAVALAIACVMVIGLIVQSRRGG